MPTFRLDENQNGNENAGFDLDGIKYNPETDFNEEQHNIFMDIMKSQDVIDRRSFEIHAIKAYQQSMIDALGASLKDG